MKVKFLTHVIVLALITISFGIVVSAQEVVGSHDSDVEISFQPGSGIVPPVNPEQPDEETGESGTNQPGPLSLDWVPALTFGSTHKVTGTVGKYSTTASRPYIQVSDLRGSGSGWKVNASMSGFTSDRPGAPASLQGAFLTLANGSPNSATNGIEEPVPARPAVLTSDDEPASIAVASSETKAGRGTWVIRWYPVNGESDVLLTVPAAAATIGTHTAIITWILYDAP